MILNNSNDLPFEIIEKILDYFVNELKTELQSERPTASKPWLKKSAYTELNTLRLISKNWSRAVIPFYFEAITIKSSKQAKLILQNWNKHSFRLSSPVKRLSIENIWYYPFPEEDNGEQEENENFPLVLMDHVANLIKLLGVNLNTLNIGFAECMGASPQLVEALKTIQDLKSLYISRDYDICDAPPHNDNSLSEIFSEIPNLKCLSIDYNILEKLNLKPQDLSNLQYLAVDPWDDNIPAISHITQATKNTLKVIEFCTGTVCTVGFERVLEPVKDTLEGLFVFSFTEQFTEAVITLEFTSLRVFGHQSCNYTSRSDEFYEDEETSWLEVVMLKNVRTIVTDRYYSQDFWRDTLNSADENGFKKGPNLKHVVFTQVGNQLMDPDLIEAFRYHGIECHVTHELTAQEIMELDLKLNGPMK